MEEDENTKCGAKTKSGSGPCQKAPIKGKKRCKFHGGLSTGPKDTEAMKGNQRAKTHGIYSSLVSEEEAGFFEDDIATLAEFQARAHLLRSYRATKAVCVKEAGGEGVTLADYDEIAARSSGAAANLLRTVVALKAAPDAGGDDSDNDQEDNTAFEIYELLAEGEEGEDEDEAGETSCE